MFSHVFVGVSDFERALQFYSALLELLGVEQRFCDATVPWTGWHGEGGTRPLFVIGKPFDGQAHDPGNGQMAAFAAKNREAVVAAHAMALALGGRGDGPPGLRPHNHAS